MSEPPEEYHTASLLIDKIYALLGIIDDNIQRLGKLCMDKEIRKIERENAKEGRALKSLEKADKKRDRFVDAGKKALKKKKKR